MQFILLCSEAYLRQLGHPKDYELLVCSMELYPESFFSVISKDIPRTFPPPCDPALLEGLRRILFAYAIRNPHVLYCQGLNYVVGYLLTHGYSEQESFWILVHLIEEVLPADYYVDMGPIICMSNVLKDIISELLSELPSVFERTGFELSMIVVPWLVCLFTKGFSSELSDHVFGLVVVEGKAALLKAAVAMIKLIGPKLDECGELTDILKQFAEETNTITVRDFKLMYDSVYINHYFSGVLLDSYLKEYWHIAEQQAREDVLKGSNNVLPECDPKSPVCLHIIELNRRLRGQ